MIIDFESMMKEWTELFERGAYEQYTHLRVLDIFSKIFIKDGETFDSDEECVCKWICKQKYNYVELDAIKGCLIGGAIGDALGLPVEFYEDYEIFKKYGENGITELQLYNNIAYISDDTQMTLFTADGLLTAAKRFENPTADDYVQCVYEAYLDWLHTQDSTFALSKNKSHSELLKIKGLHHQRAPGGTCLSALYSGKCGTLTQKLNNSKGCGGIMRVAPVALYLAQMPQMKIEDVAMVGARVAAITHSHELGYIPAACLTAFIYSILRGEMMGKACSLAKTVTKALFPNSEECERCLALVSKARELAFPEYNEEELDDLEAIRMLGQGWVAEETLAIAVYCAFKYHEDIDDFKKALIAAANHSGDSDSTAAVTGNILGAYWGLRGIPKEMVDVIEFKDLMLALAEKMHVNKLNTEIK